MPIGRANVLHYIGTTAHDWGGMLCHSAISIMVYQKARDGPSGRIALKILFSYSHHSDYRRHLLEITELLRASDHHQAIMLKRLLQTLHHQQAATLVVRI